MCMYVVYVRVWEKDLFKELAYVAMEADKFRICRVNQQAGDPEKL